MTTPTLEKPAPATRTGEKPMSIGQTIQAHLEPRRMSQLRNSLKAERDGAVCPLCRRSLSGLCIATRSYSFDRDNNLIHDDCHQVASILDSPALPDRQPPASC